MLSCSDQIKFLEISFSFVGDGRKDAEKPASCLKKQAGTKVGPDQLGLPVRVGSTRIE